MTSKDVEAVFAVRKALAADGDGWGVWMLRAVELVGVDRASELADLYG